MQHKKTLALVESAVMIAIATILSIIKIAELPYGGSITLASMLPIVIIAYRRGTGWGIASALVYSVIQQLLGLKNLTYFTTWQSIVAVILLDYVVAFTVVGLAGIFRKPVKNQAVALTLGGVFVSVLRYACHVVSGATVWAGLSIPTQAAISYSFVYNATYMIPECIILAISAMYIGSLIDFRSEKLTRIKRESTPVRFSWLGITAGFIACGATIFDVASIFSKIQNAETGEFDITGMSNVNWTAVIAVSASAAVVAILLFAVERIVKNTKKAELK